jgi:hypothetical protein
VVYNTRDYWVFGICPSSGILKNTTFRETGCFPPRKKLPSLILTGPQSRCLPPSYLMTETNPISETCSLAYRMMEKVQKPSNPEDYIYFLCVTYLANLGLSDLTKWRTEIMKLFIIRSMFMCSYFISYAKILKINFCLFATTSYENRPTGSTMSVCM